MFSAIRVGGDHARVLDEIALNHGFIGQETVGPGGFAMALRTIPVAIDYANQMLEESPSAWFINFTNPSGMVTQALLRSTTAKVIGICDGPTSIVKSAAKVLGKPYEMLQVKYVGLNHLGWVTDIVHEGNSLLSACIERYDEFVEFSDEPVYGSLGIMFSNLASFLMNICIFITLHRSLQ
ncbi:hypothetical protein [Mesotoga sp.]|uniref:family 4 glycosyl hydrolase n=1 Tax=Mesotoga sp. TaxID=2053577 RepID=UPI00345E20CF